MFGLSKKGPLLETHRRVRVNRILVSLTREHPNNPALQALAKEIQRRLPNLTLHDLEVVETQLKSLN